MSITSHTLTHILMALHLTNPADNKLHMINRWENDQLIWQRTLKTIAASVNYFTNVRYKTTQV